MVIISTAEFEEAVHVSFTNHWARVAPGTPLAFENVKFDHEQVSARLRGWGRLIVEHDGDAEPRGMGSRARTRLSGEVRCELFERAETAGSIWQSRKDQVLSWFQAFAVKDAGGREVAVLTQPGIEDVGADGRGFWLTTCRAQFSYLS